MKSRSATSHHCGLQRVLAEHRGGADRLAQHPVQAVGDDRLAVPVDGVDEPGAVPAVAHAGREQAPRVGLEGAVERVRQPRPLEPVPDRRPVGPERMRGLDDVVVRQRPPLLVEVLVQARVVVDHEPLRHPRARARATAGPRWRASPRRRACSRSRRGRPRASSSRGSRRRPARPRARPRSASRAPPAPRPAAPRRPPTPPPARRRRARRRACRSSRRPARTSRRARRRGSP